VLQETVATAASLATDLHHHVLSVKIYGGRQNFAHRPYWRNPAAAAETHERAEAKSSEDRIRVKRLL
jgi:hypothetical protein